MSATTAAILEAIKQVKIAEVDTLLQEMEKKENIDLKFAEEALWLALRGNSEKLKEKDNREKMMETLLKFPSLQKAAATSDPEGEKHGEALRSNNEPSSYYSINSEKSNGLLRYAVRERLIGITEQLLKIKSVQATLSEDANRSILLEALQDLGKHTKAKEEQAKHIHPLLKAYEILGAQEIVIPSSYPTGFGLEPFNIDTIKQWVSGLSEGTLRVTVLEPEQCEPSVSEPSLKRTDSSWFGPHGMMRVINPSRISSHIFAAPLAPGYQASKKKTKPLKRGREDSSQIAEASPAPSIDPGTPAIALLERPAAEQEQPAGGDGPGKRAKITAHRKKGH